MSKQRREQRLVARREIRRLHLADRRGPQNSRGLSRVGTIPGARDAGFRWISPPGTDHVLASDRALDELNRIHERTSGVDHDQPGWSHRRLRFDGPAPLLGRRSMS